MTDIPAAADPDPSSEQSRFVWHPQYRGQTVAEVRAALLDDLRSDQRAYAITIDGPPENESEILARVVGLEKKWGPYALDWATAEPAAIVDRAVAFERERDARQELFRYAEYRERNAPVAQSRGAGTGSGSDASDASDAPWWAFWRR